MVGCNEFPGEEMCENIAYQNNEIFMLLLMVRTWQQGSPWFFFLPRQQFLIDRHDHNTKKFHYEYRNLTRSDQFKYEQAIICTLDVFSHQPSRKIEKRKINQPQLLIQSKMLDEITLVTFVVVSTDEPGTVRFALLSVGTGRITATIGFGWLVKSGWKTAPCLIRHSRRMCVEAGSSLVPWNTRRSACNDPIPNDWFSCKVEKRSPLTDCQLGVSGMEAKGAWPKEPLNK